MTDLLEGLASMNLHHVVRQVFRHLSHKDVSACLLVSAAWRKLVREAVMAAWTEEQSCRLPL